MVFTRPLISEVLQSLYQFFSDLKSTNYNDITVTFLFHSFFSSFARYEYVSLFLVSFTFTLFSARKAKSIIRQVFVLLSITKFGHLAEKRWFLCTWKSKTILCTSFFRMDSVLPIYYLFVWSNLIFLHNTLRITLPRGCPRGVMVKALDCGIVVSEFVLQSRYYVHIRANTLGKGMNPLILPAMG